MFNLSKLFQSKLNPVYNQQNRRFAKWVDRHKTQTNPLCKLQATYNMPALVAIAQDVHKQAIQCGVTKLLFMLRDTRLLKLVFDELYPGIETAWIYANRELLRHGNDEYFDYLNGRMSRTSAFVDLAGTGRSLDIAAERLRFTPKLYVAYFVDLDKRPLRSVEVTGLVRCSKYGIDNTWLEMLNYDTSPHAYSYENGKPLFDEIDAVDQKAVTKMHLAAIRMLRDVPRVTLPNPEAVAVYAAKQIQESKPVLEKAFPNHMRIEHEKYAAIRKTREETHVITSIVNRRWNDLKHWYWSLKSSGFDGEINVMIYSRDLVLEAMLEHYGINAHLFNPMPEPWQIVVYRFRDLARIARSLPPNDWIVATDADDVVFQRDPREWLALQPSKHRIIAPSECIRFGDQWWAGPNMRDSFPDEWLVMRNQVLHNAGSIAGRAADIAELSERIYAMCLERPNARNHDQAAMNILMRGEFRDRSYLCPASDGWCWCMASTHFAREDERPKLTEPLAKIQDGEAWLPDGSERYFLLHHYTRHEQIKAAVQDQVRRRWERYRAERKRENAATVLPPSSPAAAPAGRD